MGLRKEDNELREALKKTSRVNMALEVFYG